jgi:hypothetical protein
MNDCDHAAISVPFDGHDGDASLHSALKRGALRLWIARRANAPLPAVTGPLGRVDAEQSDTFPTAAERVTVDRAAGPRLNRKRTGGRRRSQHLAASQDEQHCPGMTKY